MFTVLKKNLVTTALWTGGTTCDVNNKDVSFKMTCNIKFVTYNKYKSSKTLFINHINGSSFCISDFNL